MLSLPFAIDWQKALALFFLGQFVATHSPALSTLDTTPLTGHCRLKRRCVSITASPQLRGDTNDQDTEGSRFPGGHSFSRKSGCHRRLRRCAPDRTAAGFFPGWVPGTSFSGVSSSFHANNGPGEDNVSRRKVLTPISGLAEEMAHDTSRMAAQRQGPNPRNISAAYRMGEAMITCTIHQAELISASPIPHDLLRGAAPKHVRRSNNPAWLKPCSRRCQSNIDAPRSR